MNNDSAPVGHEHKGGFPATGPSRHVFFKTDIILFYKEE